MTRTKRRDGLLRRRDLRLWSPMDVAPRLRRRARLASPRGRARCAGARDRRRRSCSPGRPRWPRSRSHRARSPGAPRRAGARRAFRVYYLFGGLLDGRAPRRRLAPPRGRALGRPGRRSSTSASRSGVALAVPLTAAGHRDRDPRRRDAPRALPGAVLAIVGNSLGTVAAVAVALHRAPPPAARQRPRSSPGSPSPPSGARSPASARPESRSFSAAAAAAALRRLRRP